MVTTGNDDLIFWTPNEEIPGWCMYQFTFNTTSPYFDTYFIFNTSIYHFYENSGDGDFDFYVMIPADIDLGNRFINGWFIHFVSNSFGCYGRFFQIEDGNNILIKTVYINQTSNQNLISYLHINFFNTSISLFGSEEVTFETSLLLQPETFSNVFISGILYHGNAEYYSNVFFHDIIVYNTSFSPPPPEFPKFCLLERAIEKEGFFEVYFDDISFENIFINSEYEIGLFSASDLEIGLKRVNNTFYFYKNNLEYYMLTEEITHFSLEISESQVKISINQKFVEVFNYYNLNINYFKINCYNFDENDIIHLEINLINANFEFSGYDTNYGEYFSPDSILSQSPLFVRFKGEYSSSSQELSYSFFSKDLSYLSYMLNINGYPSADGSISIIINALNSSGCIIEDNSLIFDFRQTTLVYSEDPYDYDLTNWFTIDVLSDDSYYYDICLNTEASEVNAVYLRENSTHAKIGYRYFEFDSSKNTYTPKEQKITVPFFNPFDSLFITYKFTYFNTQPTFEDNFLNVGITAFDFEKNSPKQDFQLILPNNPSIHKTPTEDWLTSLFNFMLSPLFILIGWIKEIFNAINNIPSLIISLFIGAVVFIWDVINTYVIPFVLYLLTSIWDILITYVPYFEEIVTVIALILEYAVTIALILLPFMPIVFELIIIILNIITPYIEGFLAYWGNLYAEDPIKTGYYFIGVIFLLTLIPTFLKASIKDKEMSFDEIFESYCHDIELYTKFMIQVISKFINFTIGMIREALAFLYGIIP